MLNERATAGSHTYGPLVEHPLLGYSRQQALHIIIAIIIVMNKTNTTNSNAVINESSMFYRYHSETPICN